MQDTIPEISFLIVNFNGNNTFKECIHAIEADMSGVGNYEIVVVDNASTEKLDWLKKIPHLTLIRNNKNLFFAEATNQSVRASCGEYLFILNNDVVLQKGTVSTLLRALINTKADAVVPQLLNRDGSVQKSITGIPTWKDILKGALGIQYWHPRLDKWRLYDYDYSHTHRVYDQPMFSALLLKRSAWENVGELDSRFPLLWNDVDWFYRFHRCNKVCYYVSSAQAHHLHGMSVNKNRWRKNYWLSEGCYRFILKTSKNKSPLFRTAVFLLCAITYIERIPLELMDMIRGFIGRR